jgi:hypothetical protein
VSTRATQGLLEQLIARDALTRLIDDVSETGARVMPLKGVLLVALGVRRSGERPMIDVDVLVEPQLARGAVLAARRRGWEARMGNDYACMLVHPKTPSTSIDLHRALFRRHFFRMPTEPVFERATRDEKLFGRPVMRMDSRDLYAHLIGHFVKGREDARHTRHVKDFAAVGRWIDATPAACADHLVRLGLSRAARYALPIAVRLEGDAFGAEVLRALPRDRRGSMLAFAADRVIERVEPGSMLAVPFVHALNSSLPRGARSLAAWLTEPKEDADRSRDAWWQP